MVVSSSDFVSCGCAEARAESDMTKSLGRAVLFPGWLALRPGYLGDATLVGGVDPVHTVVRTMRPRGSGSMWRLGCLERCGWCWGCYPHGK